MQNKYQQPELSMEQRHGLWVKMHYIKNDKALIMTQYSKGYLPAQGKPFFSTYMEVTFEETDGTARNLDSLQSSCKSRQRHFTGTEPTAE